MAEAAVQVSPAMLTPTPLWECVFRGDVGCGRAAAVASSSSSGFFSYSSFSLPLCLLLSLGALL